MRTLTQKDLNTLQKLFTLNQRSLKKFMFKYLRTKYKDIVETNDYIYAKGNIPVALVAHMDTVFKTQPESFYYDQKKNVLWSPEGLGADDRAGVFSMILILRGNLRPHIILTTDEEIGGVGAFSLSKIQNPFEELNYMIELDRRGSDDCVFYDCVNNDFTKYVESFGFSENYGSFSDISILCPAWGIAGVNLSVGYMNEHSTSELLFISQMLNTVEKVKKMLSEENIPFFKYIEDPYMKYYEAYYGDCYPGYYDYDYGIHQITCQKCKKPVPFEEAFEVKLLDGAIGFYCGDCLCEQVGWCSCCKEAFEIEPGGDGLTCIRCKEKESHKSGKNSNKKKGKKK